MSARPVWPALLVVGTAAEVRSLRCHDGATLSEVTRDVYHVDTTIGRAAFIATAIGAAVGVVAWFIPHILRGAARAVDELVTAIEEATP